MAKRRRTIDITYDAQTAGYKRKVNDAEKFTVNSTSRMQKSSALLSASYKRLGGVIAGSFGAYQVGNFLKESIAKAGEQERSEKKVEQAVRSTGRAAGYSAEQLKKVASELQKITTFGDEEILNKVTAQLLTFTNITKENFQRTQKAVLDLATVLDGDLQSASIMLGKALNDPVANLSALSRAGIQFSKNQKEIVNNLVKQNKLFDAQSIILDELNKQYGGQAEAQIDTYSGKVKQLTNVWGDFQETIGNAVIPTLNTLIPLITKAIEGFAGIKEVKPGVFSEDQLRRFYDTYKTFTPQMLADESKDLTKQVEDSYNKIQELRSKVDPFDEKMNREGFRVDKLLSNWILPEDVKDTVKAERELLKVEQARFNLLVEQARIADDLLYNREAITNKFDPKATPTAVTTTVKPKIIQGDYSGLQGLLGMDYDMPINLVGPKTYRTKEETAVDVFGESWINESLANEQKLFDDMMFNAAQLGYALEDAFSGHGNTLLSQMSQALQIAVGISNALNKNDGSIGGILGVAASFVPGLGMLFGGGRASGGNVNSGYFYKVNEKGTEMLSVGNQDYLMMGANAGNVTPHERINLGAVSGGANNMMKELVGINQAQVAMIDQLKDVFIKTKMNTKLDASLKNTEIYLSNDKGSRIYKRYHG